MPHAAALHLAATSSTVDARCSAPVRHSSSLRTWMRPPSSPQRYAAHRRTRAKRGGVAIAGGDERSFRRRATAPIGEGVEVRPILRAPGRIYRHFVADMAGVELYLWRRADMEVTAARFLWRRRPQASHCVVDGRRSELSIRIIMLAAVAIKLILDACRDNRVRYPTRPVHSCC